MATAKKTEDAKKVTKATPAAALAKVEAVKKEEAAKKTVAKETVAKETVAKEAAPAKKAAAPAKKALAKKEAAAKTVEKVFIEFAGGQIEMSAIVDKAKEVIGKKTVKELNVYYQPETGMVYYTADGESGSYSL